MLKRLFSIIVLLAIAFAGRAQELNCTVRLLHEKITGVDPEVFKSMERSIKEFLNSHKWTTDDFEINEKIEFSIMLNLTGRVNGDNDGYTATLNIQSSRPVYNAGMYNSPTINYVDKDIVFHYSQFTPINFDDNRITGSDPLASNLTAVLAFYAYLVIGLDYDSFAPSGGTVYLKKAQNVVNNAPDGKSITGWKNTDGTHNRYWIIDQLLSPRFQEFRNFWYMMHREGLDNMYTKPVDSRTKILAGLTKLQQLNRENPSSILLQFFFNAKSDEIMRMVAQMPKEDRGPYVLALSQMDVANAAKYNTLK